MKLTKQEIGQLAEKLSCYYLEQHGLTLQHKNFYSRYGEIDLIMRDGDYVCFIEVRARKYHVYGTALDTVNIRKQQKIIQTAHYYLQMYPENEQLIGRFDVIVLEYKDAKIWQSVEMQTQLQQIDLQWIQDAYTL